MKPIGTVRLLLLAAVLALAAWGLLQISPKLSTGTQGSQQTQITNDTGVPAATKCIVTGCSKELCVDESEADIVTPCVYLDEYACYKGATCEIQPNGSCGWTQTNELKSCLMNPPKIDSSTEAPR